MTASGVQQFDLPEAEWPLVEPGDFIGVHYINDNGTIPYVQVLFIMIQHQIITNNVYNPRVIVM